MKLLSILVSILALSHSASGGRVIIGSNNKTWSPVTKVPSECEQVSKHVEDFIHIHKNDLDSVCDKFPESYKAHCTQVVLAKYPPEVVCEALKSLEPREKSYWLAFLG
jgi:hypothetical protein